MTDYRNINVAKARYGLITKDIAKALKLSIGSVSNKINGFAPWHLREAQKVVDYFNDIGGAERHTITELFEEYLHEEPCRERGEE